MFFKKKEKKDPHLAGQNILPAIAAKSAYAESFRTLRANLYFSVVDKSVKSIVITSALESEGKTNTAANLGYTIANTGKRVLLVDSDLRKPFLTKVFNLNGKAGLTDLLVEALDCPVIDGSLSEYSIADLIQLIRFQNLTGRLDLVTDQNNIVFYFKDGNIMDVKWQNRPFDSDYMVALVQDKVIPPKAADTVLELTKKTGRRRRSILLSMGFIARPDLEKRLAIESAEAMRLAAGIVSGTFTFSRLPWEALELSVCPNMDFNTVFRELFDRTEDMIYINRSMDAVIHPTKTQNLFVLGAGRTPPNPSEIINSDRTEMVIDQLKKKFDLIIIDIAPVLPASDAMLMAPRTDGTLLVIRSGYANKKLIKQVLDQYRQSNLPVLGAILNRVDVKKQDYYYRYYQEY